MLQGAQFPPVVVFGEAAGNYWLADGYHRWHRATIAGLQTIAADVRAGGRREAILHSVGANAEHGWRRTNEDKRRAVLALLNDPEWRQWSDREIARRCGVAPSPVGALRPRQVTVQVGQLDQQQQATRTYIDKHGNTSPMDTAGIGRIDPEPDYPLREDLRQIDIVDAVEAYDRAAGDLRVRVSDLVKQLAAANWPTPEEAHAAWMKGRGERNIRQMRSLRKWRML